MTLLYGRFVSAIAALLVLGCSAASACDPGEVVCDNGHKYSCHCWSGPPCEFYPSGTCHHGDSDFPPAAASNFDLLMNKYIREAQLVCGRPSAALDVCSGH